MIISIDGPAGSGKSTVAKLISEKLGFIHLNSGSIYRGITAYLLSINFDIKGITTTSEVPNFDVETKFINGVQYVFVNNIDFTSELRKNNISTLSPFVSTNKTIRERIDNCQRKFAQTNNIVVDGRDIGSHVFPNADYKFYLDCDVKERAKRRFKEEQEKKSNITLEEIEKQLLERDYIDKNKQIAPLIVPKNAIIVDSSNLTINEVGEKILSYISIKN